MEQFEVLLYYILLSIAAIVFINDSIILFIRERNSRPRRMLGITTLIWGIAYLLLIIASYTGKITYPVFSGEAMISSHFFICIMFLFPLEVLLPKWINWKRILIMFTPIIVLSSIYLIGLRITGQHIEEFMDFKSFWEGIGRFNVWYRFILFICNLLFIYVLMTLLNQNEGKYIKWQNENFSDLESVDISWMNDYKKIMIVILLCYIIVAIWGTRWSINIHTFIVIICFSILFYKGLFHEGPKYEDISESLEVTKEQSTENLVVANDEKEGCAGNDYSFEAKLPEYVDLLKTWMENEKPYLYKEFKLIDTARALPLNRSYLSRVFNEGFNQSFSEVVRMYRIEYAKSVLLQNPDLPQYKVAELCGFSSDNTFIKAFQKVTGITPKQFRMNPNTLGEELKQEV